jgi:hypothetical protein
MREAMVTLEELKHRIHRAEVSLSHHQRELKKASSYLVSMKENVAIAVDVLCDAQDALVSRRTQHKEAEQ